MPRPRSAAGVFKLLMEHDGRFQLHEWRGKGSHRMIYHPSVNGAPASYPVKYHGRKTELGRGTLSAIIRRFDLPRSIFD